jgi:endonuclease-3
VIPVDRETADRIYRLLLRVYPHAGEAVRHHAPPFEALILTILSAQTTDDAVDRVTGDLFSRYPDARALAEARQEDVEQIIHSTGFYRMKAKHIIGASQVLVREYGGRVPASMDALVTLPGVGRKTANIVLYHAFGIQAGVAVDTHVFRLSQRIGFSAGNSAEAIETDLMGIFPSGRWGTLTDLLISHGRAICTARKPRCPECPIRDDCRYYRDVYLQAGT